jgi:MFS family permease
LPPLSPFRRWLALIVLLAGAFLPPVDFFIVNVTMPSIHASLGATPAELQLVISGYAAAYATFLITGGRLGDLFGRRGMFLLGMAGFTAANLLCGLAQTPLHLLLGRLVQGMAAAVLVPQVLGSIRALCEDERELARALSAYGVMMGLAAAIGQFAGGALVQWSPFGWSWRTVFLLKLPLCLAILAAGWGLVPRTGGTNDAKLDLPGAGLISLTLACVILPLAEGRDQHWPAWIFIPLACAPLLIAAFLWHEARLAARGGMPLVDLSLFRIPGFRRGVLIGTLFFFTTSFYFLFGLYQQEGRGADPFHTGLAIMPYGAGLFLGPIASGPFMRFASRLLSIGMAIQVTGYFAIGVFVAWGLSVPAVTIAVLIAGFGQGIAFPRLYNTVLSDVPPAQAGLAAGVLNSALQIGTAISLAVIGGFFFTTLGDQHTERGYAHAFALAQYTLSTALFVAMLISIPPKRRA